MHFKNRSSSTAQSLRKMLRFIVPRNRQLQPSLTLVVRSFSATTFRAAVGKPPIVLVAQLRKLTEVSMSKAREALVASSHDIQGALVWLEEDLVVSGMKKAAKVSGRRAAEGLVGVCVLSEGLGVVAGRGSIVEVNCETDL